MVGSSILDLVDSSCNIGNVGSLNEVEVLEPLAFLVVSGVGRGDLILQKELLGDQFDLLSSAQERELLAG